MAILSSEPPNPSDLPAKIGPHRDEPVFDPGRHLALEMPERVWTLQEFGYDAAVRASTPSNVAVTSPFRLLSNEGVAALRAILRDLKPEADCLQGRRLSTFLRRSSQRSAFVRDMVRNPALLTHLSAIAGTPLGPHSIPSMQAFVNYSPEDPKRSVDSWHVDSIAFDAVLMVSDPGLLQGGGRLQYFSGTRAELTRRLDLEEEGQLVLGYTQELPKERICEVDFPAAGYAVFMQGDMVFHRAARLKTPAERITLVAGFLARSLGFRERTNTAHMQIWGDDSQLVDCARHAAWLSREKLSALLEALSYGSSDPRAEMAEALEAAIEDATRVAREMREAQHKTPVGEAVKPVRSS